MPVVVVEVFLVVIALTAESVLAYDPSPLQDFCVSVNSTKDAIFVNGKFCKDRKLASADDFTFTGFRTPGNTYNPLGLKVTPAFVDQFPGINTLGISMASIDFAPDGLNPPHTHPRGTELLVVVERTLYVGFVYLQPARKPSLHNGSVPRRCNCHNHCQLGIRGTAPNRRDVLTKAFQVDKGVVKYLRSQFCWDN